MSFFILKLKSRQIGEKIEDMVYNHLVIQKLYNSHRAIEVLAPLIKKTKMKQYFYLGVLFFLFERMY
ncbi:hypothetical protein J2Y02_000442 [Neobacillus drentensis]|nr:hypothetical protein [Neobacillus drentensis]